LRNPAAVRPWQHVLEPLSGYLTAAEYLLQQGAASGKAWNFGPDPASERTVEFIARRCCEIWGSPGAVGVVDNHDAPHEAGILRLDSGLARRELGWKPRWNLEETLRQTTAWYRAFGAGEDMRAVTLAQIQTYLAAR
jgi:CDP-glucose 4,6-dehydratase